MSVTGRCIDADKPKSISFLSLISISTLYYTHLSLLTLISFLWWQAHELLALLCESTGILGNAEGGQILVDSLMTKDPLPRIQFPTTDHSLVLAFLQAILATNVKALHGHITVFIPGY